jgi:uncharacterized membrane protein YqjE
LLESLRNFTHTLLGAVQTRVELFADELEEQGARVARIAALWALAGLSLSMAVVLGSILLVVLFWDTHKVLVLALLTALFALVGIGAAFAGRGLAASRPRTLSQTIAELERDRAALRAGNSHGPT